MAAKMMMIAETVTPTARAIELRAGSGAFAGGRRVSSTASGASPMLMPGAAEQPLEVERAERGLDDVADDAREDQPGEEEQAGAEQPRQEGEHFVGQRW